MFKWRMKATNAIYLEDSNGQEGRPFKSRFLQAGLVKYDFGVCLLKKETIDKFVNTFVGNPVIINHKDNLTEADRVGTINKIWFSAEDGWFWCEGVITDNTAVELIEKGYNVSCQYRITEYSDNTEGKLHNANPYDKEILNGVFEHLAIVENPRYEDAFIAVNGGKYNLVNEIPTCSPGAKAYIAANNDFKEDEHPRDDEGKFTDGNGSDYKKELKSFIEKAKDNPNERTKLNIGKVSDKLQKEAQKYGLDLTDYTHDLDVSGTRHAYKNHGDEKKEANRGQIAITDDDFEKIPDIINNYDTVNFGEKDNKGTPLIKYKKQYTDGTTYYVEEVRTKHKNLTIKTMYKSKKASNSGLFADLNPQRSEYTSNIIITDNQTDFNPDTTMTVSNSVTKYQKVFEWLQTTKGESMDNETKGLFSALVEALKARNEAEDEKDKKDAEKATNEEVDKRDIIRQIMAIASKHEDNEDVRTIAKLAEKLAYDKSEAGTADNSKAKNADEDEDGKKDDKSKDDEEAKNKCKNEGDEGHYEKLYKELKEKVGEEAANKTAKNSLDEAVNILYSALTPEPKELYISEEKGLELGKQIYG